MILSNGLFRFILFCFALSLFLPSVSIINIGNSTSIQVSVIFCGLLLVHYYLVNKIKCTYSQLLWMLLLVALTLVQVNYFIFEYDLLDKYLKAILNLPIIVLYIIVGYMIISTGDSNRFWNYFRIAATLNSIWAVLQYVFWRVLGQDLPFIVGFHNATSFATWANIVNYVKVGRSFAFTPEPSLLFILLAPALIVAIYFRKKMSIFIISLGIISTSSFGITIVLPLAFYFFYVITRRKNNSYKYVIPLFLIILFFMVGSVDIENNVAKSIHSKDVIARASQFYLDPSFLSRFNSIATGIDIMKHHPFLGLGLQSDMLIDKLVKNSTVLEDVTGITSFLISMFCWFGSFFTLLIFYPIFRFVFSSTYKVLDRIAIFTVILGCFVSLNYYNFYISWIAIGMSLNVFRDGNKAFYQKFNRKQRFERLQLCQK